MATKFLTLEDAAKELGISPEQLNELRQRQDIYGYRDGASWKFKVEEVERLREKRANVGDEMTIDSDNDEIVLMSEFELGESGPSPSSTVIGQSIPGTQKPASDESDLNIGGSDLKLQDSTAMSDVRLASQSDILPVGDSPSGLPIDLSQEAASDDVTQLGIVDSGISLGEDATLTDDLSAGSGISLGEEELDDDVLGGPASGSDITHRPSDSGILLIDPGDSGLSLDQAPLDLTGGSDAPTTDFASLEDSAELPGDDDFLLTTLDDAAEDESDSGSQVIMLDTEGEFDDATATLLGGQVPGASEMSLDGGLGLGGAGGRAARGPAPVQTIVVQRESSFTALSIVGLACCTLLLTFTGMMMFDLIRNMWSWNGPSPLNSSIMDTLLGR